MEIALNIYVKTLYIHTLALKLMVTLAVAASMSLGSPGFYKTHIKKL